MPPRLDQPLTEPIGPTLVLIGLRACGKTTAGRALADRLRRGFADTDDRTLESLGCDTVEQAWRTRGEPAFREAEVVALEHLLLDPAVGVIACGGGTPEAPRARDVLLLARNDSRALVAYLRAEPPVLAARLGEEPDASRPRLGAARSISEEMLTVFARRDPLYRQMADHVIDASASIADVIDRIERWYRGARQAASE